MKISDLVSLLFWTTLDLKSLIFDRGKFWNHLSHWSQSVWGIFPLIPLHPVWIPPTSSQRVHVYGIPTPLTKADMAPGARATGVARGMGEMGLQLMMFTSAWFLMSMNLKAWRPLWKLSERVRMLGILDLGGALPPCSAFAFFWSGAWQTTAQWQRMHNPQSLKYLFSGLLQKEFADPLL